MAICTPVLSLFLLLTLRLSTAKGQDDDFTASNTSRILNGVNALYPPRYLVSLQLVRAAENTVHICGAVVIGTEYVLTAGTCVNNRRLSQLRVLAGVVNLSSTIGSSHAVVKVVISENISRGNNLAILRVSPALPLGAQITVADIPKDPVIKTGDMALLYGWGAFGPSGVMTTLAPKQLLTKIISYSSCQEFYAELDPDALCTFISLGKGICFGDSGGPLILARTNELIGIISGGVLICGRRYPDVSTSISANEQFILEAMSTMAASSARDDDISEGSRQH